MTQCDHSEEKPDCTSEGTGLLPVRKNARDKVIYQITQQIQLETSTRASYYHNTAEDVLMLEMKQSHQSKHVVLCLVQQKAAVNRLQ